MEKEYKGTIIRESLTDQRILEKLHIVKEYVEDDQDNPENNWHLVTVMVSKDEISEIQPFIKREGGWYMHFWKGNDVIVVFRDKTFTIKYNDKTTWKDAVDYGLSMGVPAEQLDFLIKE